MINTPEEFAKSLKIHFKNIDLLERVFIHRSYLNENRKENIKHNERLEFLGDAVLELIVTEHLYNNYNNPEGELTNWRSAIVKGEMLCKVAKKLNMGTLLKLSKGEEKSGGKNRNLLLANAFEALIGAIYLDCGFDKSKEFIEKQIIVELPKIIEDGSFIDAKSRLQEVIQEKKSITPEYKVLSEEGPDHAKEFKIGAYIGNKMIGEGKGSSKRKAEQEAAKQALAKLSN